MSEAKPRRVWRRLLIILAVLVLLPVLGVAAVVLTLDTEALKPRITAAVEAATGRRLALRGPISFTPALVPTIAIEDIALANIAGGSAPEMLTARRIELRLALMPLLSRAIDIRSLTIAEPRLLLETDAEGRPNWLFAASRPVTPPNEAPANPVPAPTREPGAGMALGVQSLTLTGGTVTYRNGITGTTRAVAIERLTTRATAPGLSHEARISLDGAALRVNGETGTIAEFLAPRAPWPLRLTLEAEGMTLTLRGEAAEPARLRGWTGQVEGTLDSLSRLAPYAPQLAGLPQASGITLRVAAHEAGGAPAINSLHVAVGATDLGALRPGLALRSLTLSAEAADAPVTITAEGALGRLPLVLNGTLGRLAALLPGAAAAPLPMDVRLVSGEASIQIQGTPGTLAAGDGMALAFATRIPAVAAIAALADLRAPALRDLAATGRVTRPEAGRIAVSDLRATSSAGDIAGALTLATGARPNLSGTLTSQRIDLTALAMPSAPPPVAPGTPAAPAAPAPPAAAGQRRVIPEVPIDLGALRGADADLRIQVASLQATAELPLTAVTAHVVLRDGRLVVDPLSATTPGGALAGTIAADASVTPATLRLALRGDGIDLAALRPAIGERFGYGRVDVDFALAGAGANTRAMAASLDGHVALALVDGRIPQSALAGIPPDVLRVLVPQGIPPEGLALRCFALRAPATTGTLRAETFLMETSFGRIGATGTINLGDERIELRLLPDLRTSIINLRAPIPLAGTLGAPRLGRMDAGAAAAAGLNALLGTQRTPDRTLEGAAEALGGGAPALPDCTTALAAARGGRPGAAPATPGPASPPANQPGDTPRAPNAADILRGLLGGGRR
ncbi:MAG: AsmA family protein [Pseudomonadota bacterium]